MTISTLIHAYYLYEIVSSETDIHSIRRFSEDNNYGVEVDFDELEPELQMKILVLLQDEHRTKQIPDP